MFLLAVCGWLTPALIKLSLGPGHPWTEWSNRGLDEGIVALLCGLLLCLMPSGKGDGKPVLAWERAVQLDWSTLLLLGGGLSLGKLMFETGLAKAVADAALGFGGSAGRVAVRAAGVQHGAGAGVDGDHEQRGDDQHDGAGAAGDRRGRRQRPGADGAVRDTWRRASPSCCRCRRRRTRSRTGPGRSASGPCCASAWCSMSRGSIIIIAVGALLLPLLRFG
jgi:hypothetical protein